MKLFTIYTVSVLLLTASCSSHPVQDKEKKASPSRLIYLGWPGSKCSGQVIFVSPDSGQCFFFHDAWRYVPIGAKDYHVHHPAKNGSFINSSPYHYLHTPGKGIIFIRVELVLGNIYHQIIAKISEIVCANFIV